MKKNREEQFYKFLISFLSLDLASILIASSILIGGTHTKLKEAQEEYPKDLSRSSQFDELTEEEQQSLKRLDSELTMLLNQEEYALENVSSLEDYYLLTAILENENLSTYEKQYLYRSYEIIKENPYLDKKDVYARLKTLDVTRKEEKGKTEKKKIWLDDSVVINASYRINLNHLTFYDYPNLTSSTITHEMLHVVYPCSKLPRAFGEGFAELLNTEYFDDLVQENHQNSYLQEIAYVKILCEILGSEKVLQIASFDDQNLLEEELLSKFENEASVKRWMHVDKMDDDTLFDYYEDLVFLTEKNQYSKQKQETLVSLYYQLIFGENNSTTYKYFNREDTSTKQKVKEF